MQLQQPVQLEATLKAYGKALAVAAAKKGQRQLLSGKQPRGQLCCSFCFALHVFDYKKCANDGENQVNCCQKSLEQQRIVEDAVE